MALEHAILVSLLERPDPPPSGLDLTRRFDRSIGFFWSATHQQIYRTLARMVADGWVRARTVAEHGRGDKKVYAVTAAGRRELERWTATPSGSEPFRSDLAVKLRGASYGDRAAVLDQVRGQRAEHATRLAHYRQLAEREADRGPLEGHDLDVHLVLLGGIRLEEFWVGWLTDCLDAYPGGTP